MKKNILFWIAIFIILCFSLHLAYWLFIDATESPQYTEMTDEERKEVKRLFRKHGNAAATCSSGMKNCYFIRDGKKCKWR